MMFTNIKLKKVRDVQNEFLFLYKNVLLIYRKTMIRYQSRDDDFLFLTPNQLKWDQYWSYMMSNYCFLELKNSRSNFILIHSILELKEQISWYKCIHHRSVHIGMRLYSKNRCFCREFRKKSESTIAVIGYRMILILLKNDSSVQNNR